MEKRFTNSQVLAPKAHVTSLAKPISPLSIFLCITVYHYGCEGTTLTLVMILLGILVDKGLPCISIVHLVIVLTQTTNEMQATFST